MKHLLFFFIFFSLEKFDFAQVKTFKIIDFKTGQPIFGVSIYDSFGNPISYSNEDGLFQIAKGEGLTFINIKCLGYIGRRIFVDSLRDDSVFELTPATYSLPAVYIGKYADYLVRKAFQKADSSNSKFYFGKGIVLQLFWVNHLPAECYEYFEDEKINAEGINQRRISKARHGVLPKNLNDFSLDYVQPLLENSVWYYGPVSFNKLFRGVSCRIEKFFYWDSSVVAEIYYKVNLKKKITKDGYLYIDTSTFEIVRNEVSYFKSKIKYSFLGSLNDLSVKFTQEYSPTYNSYAPIMLSTKSVSYIFSNHSGSEKDTINYYENTYHMNVIPWDNRMTFGPNNIRADNKKLYKNYNKENWNNQIPVVFSTKENNFLKYMERNDGFK